MEGCTASPTLRSSRRRRRIQVPNRTEHLPRSTTGSAGGDIKCPRGIASDSEGHIFIADYCDDHIDEYTQGGELIEQIGSEGSGEEQLNTPTWVAINPLQRRPGHRRPRQLPDSDFKKGVGGKYEPGRIGIKGTENGSSIIPRASPKSTKRATSRSPKTSTAVSRNSRPRPAPPGNINTPRSLAYKSGRPVGSAWGVAVSQSNIYVADQGSNRVKKWVLP